MAWIAALYFATYSALALCAAGLTRIVVSLGNTKSLGVVDIAGGQHSLLLAESFVLKPSFDGTHVEMSGVVIGDAKAAGMELKLTVL